MELQGQIGVHEDNARNCVQNTSTRCLMSRPLFSLPYLHPFQAPSLISRLLENLWLRFARFFATLGRVSPAVANVA